MGSIFEPQRVSCVTSGRRIPINYNGWWAGIYSWLVVIAINSGGLNDITAAAGSCRAACCLPDVRRSLHRQRALGMQAGAPALPNTALGWQLSQRRGDLQYGNAYRGSRQRLVVCMRVSV